MTHKIKPPNIVYYNVKAKYLFELLNTEREHDSDIEYIPAESLKELHGVWENYKGLRALDITRALDNLAKKMGWTNDR